MLHTLEFYSGQEVHFDSLAKQLTDFGYHRQSKVSAEGEFAIRGSILDIFPRHFSMPIRLELHHETVENIRSFDASSGALLESHRMAVVLPIDPDKHAPKRSALWTSIEDYQSPIDPFVDIESGDYVVHILHGIARFRGIQKIKNKAGREEPTAKALEGVDHFVLEFAEKNRLYVPTRDLHLIQRYVAFGKAARPELSRLGSKQWEKLKEKAKKGVLSYASELLEMEAKRKALKGFAFAKDVEWQSRLEDEFPYEETEDQVRAVAEVKRDMESSTPMDRLLCGDVDYGKTEVALRAAFKAVMNGKQVAMLVPTTLLAEQHYETFSERMKNFPVRIHMLSRFQSKGQQHEIVDSIRAGSCDIIIGTHRLLSPDVSFKDLGLVIIDEEQRFGVRHKESLKKLRLLVDVLTLTATPIPRTLYLSLVGAKDMSTINTPPKDRRPIKTVVIESDEKQIQQALKHELDRKGQIFFVHNRVKGIEALARHIQALAPGARVAVGHGQMPAKALEKVMHDFIHGAVDVLVCTTIVESGIDIPNANTIIINRSDRFGLSELYQLRGRVGRFNREAYAYLLVPKGSGLSEESKKRLEAIEKFTHLGAGFNLAMQDLEIRGAGDILGTRQHGTIATIGFDLYCRILKESIKHLRKSRGAGHS